MGIPLAISGRDPDGRSLPAVLVYRRDVKNDKEIYVRFLSMLLYTQTALMNVILFRFSPPIVDICLH